MSNFKNWQEIRVSELVTLLTDYVSNGSFASLAKNVKYQESGYARLIRLVDYNKNFDENDAVWISKESYEFLEKSKLFGGEIIISNVGEYAGKTFIAPKLDYPTSLAPNSIMLKTKGNDKFYYYYFKSPEGYIKIRNIVTKSGQPKFNKTNFKELLVPYPPIEIQTKIAHTLESLDNKINNNNKINTELESIAKTIYDYWFLQFEFPNEEGKPYKSSGGKMVWNEELKREIPEGWECKKISELCSFSNGINYDKNEIGDKNYKIVNVRNITSSSILLNSNDLDEINLLSSQAEKYIIGSNDILVARSGSPGAIRLLYSNEKDIIYCGFIIKCSPNNENHRLFLTYSLKVLEGSNATKTGGSIMQNVSQDTLKQVKVCLPAKNIIDKFNSTVNPIFHKMQQIINENKELSSLRDFLLPLLMNGQVGFKEEALAEVE